MKQLKLTCLYLAFIIMAGTKVFAYNYKADGICYILNSNNQTATVTYSGYPYNNDYTGHYASSSPLKDKDIVIPSTIIQDDVEYTVTAIGDLAFYDCESNILMSSVTLPSTITSIGKLAFTRCSNLTSFTIPSSVISIGSQAFSGCSSLVSVTMERKIPISIDAYTFTNCANATLYVPAGCKAAYEAADYWKDFKEIVEIQEDNSIINFADANVKALCVSNWDTDGDGELSKDEASAVTNLKYVFKERQNITSFDELQYFTGLTNINANAFYGCSGLTRITLPTSLTSIGEYSFGGCSSLTSITIPSGVKIIGSWAFNDSGLSSVVFPNGLTSIGSYAFHGTDITSVAIPSTVTVIGDAAFGYCQKLSSIAVESGNTKYSSYDNCNAIIDTETNTLIAGCKNTKIPSSVVKIANVAFRGCQMTSLDIPLSVEVIGAYAFNQCDKLISVCIPSNVTNIGEWAFYGCSNLVSVTIQRKTPISINAYTFSNRANAILYVPAGSKAAYEAADYWKEFKEIVEMEEVIEPTDISTLTDAIFIEPTSGLVGTTVKLDVKMKNQVTVNGCSFKLTLPEGFTLAKDSDGDIIYELSNRAKKMSVVMKDLEKGTYDFALTPSTATATISGNDDTFITLVVQIPEDATVGDYMLKLSKNLIQNKVDNVTQDTPLSDVVSTITVEDYVVGDVNGDGNIDAQDASLVLQYVAKKIDSVQNADINNDGNVDAQDASLILQYVAKKISW